ncbi:MAG: TonB family protein [Woeseiaceae bacterium]|nr:TonB family protein [Woeseiaceae bacterium]
MFARYASAVTTGTVVTLGLFYIMQMLIEMNTNANVDARDRAVVSIVKVREDSELIKDQPPDRFDQLKEPIVSPPRPANPADDGPVIKVPTQPPPPGPVGPGPVSLAQSDGPLVAMLRVQPVYPSVAAERGLEGWVLVQFDVAEDGTVENIFVVQSSHRIFERASIRAAERLRYRPQVVDGLPVRTPAVQNLFRFELDD